MSKLQSIIFFLVPLIAFAQTPDINSNEFTFSWEKNKDIYVQMNPLKVAQAPSFESCTFDPDWLNLPMRAVRVALQSNEEIQLAFAAGSPTSTGFKGVLDKNSLLKINGIYPAQPVIVSEPYFIKKQKFQTVTFYGGQIDDQQNLSIHSKLQYKIDKIKVNKSVSKTTRVYAPTSVLSSGDWYKIPISENGVYKLDVQYFKSLGINTDNINPDKIRIFGNGGRMLAQANSTIRKDDLYENSIEVQSGNDGKFNGNDYVLFFAEGAHQVYMDTNEVLTHQLNLYSDQNYYFLNVEQAIGKRISDQVSLSNPVNFETCGPNLKYYEVDETNFIKSGRMWFGPEMDFVTNQEISFSMPELCTGSNIKMNFRGAARSCNGVSSLFTVYEGGTPMDTVVFPPVDCNRTDETYYAWVNQASVSYIPVSNGTDGSLELNAVYTKGSLSKAYIDYIEVEYEEKWKIQDYATFYCRKPGLTNLSLVGNNGTIWDVTNSLDPVRISTNSGSNSTDFTIQIDSAKTFVTFRNNGFKTPVAGFKIPNQNLHALTQADYIIVTQSSLSNASNQLATFHQGLGQTTHVVFLNEIYNEFSSGKQDVTAIRDFVKMFYDRAGMDTLNMLKSLCLMGDGQYDPKGRVQGVNIVPTYQSRESSRGPNSYSSDDYFSFLDDNEGFWGEGTNLFAGDTRIDNHFCDIGVGRIPAQNETEAINFVNKIIQYATNTDARGPWRNKALFIGDVKFGTGVECFHMDDADKCATKAQSAYNCLNVDKIYLDTYPQVNVSDGVRFPDAKNKLLDRLGEGQLIVNYTGHGSNAAWSNSRILEVANITTLKNGYRLPFYVTATCEFGRWDLPTTQAGAELLLSNNEGGAIGLFTSARVVYSTANLAFNLYFYNHALYYDNTNQRYLTLSEIYIRTKNESWTSPINSRNFSLLADPGLTLNYPKENAVLTSINGKTVVSSVSDTIKAKQLVTLQGEIRNKVGTKQSNFTGDLYVTIYDKPSTLKTYNCNSAFPLQKNTIFNGVVSVVNGDFTSQFVVPLDINYEAGFGKISMYAGSNSTDAGGCNTNIVICCTDTNAIADSLGPDIFAFLNDEKCWIDGGLVGQNPVLNIKLKDLSGINTTGIGIGREVLAVLDDNVNAPYILNEYYTANKNSYQEGTVKFQMRDIASGEHSLKIKAWDVNNNSAETYLKFIVANDAKIAMDHVLNYPNPFTTKTTFFFEHNKIGENIDVHIQIFTITGKVVKTFNENIYAEGHICDRIEWDGLDEFGDKIGRGAYVYKVTLRVPRTGETIHKYEKLVILR